MDSVLLLVQWQVLVLILWDLLPQSVSYTLHPDTSIIRQAVFIIIFNNNVVSACILVTLRSLVFKIGHALFAPLFRPTVSLAVVLALLPQELTSPYSDRAGARERQGPFAVLS
jgi:hypothetical protein